MDVQPDEVTDLQRRGAVQLIDVREDYEWDEGRIPGARHVPLPDVAAQADSIDREAPVVFVCRTGGRSGLATQAFRRAGYDAYNLAGGMVAWAGRGLPLDPPDGRVADH